MSISLILPDLYTFGTKSMVEKNVKRGPYTSNILVRYLAFLSPTIMQNIQEVDYILKLV